MVRDDSEMSKIPPDTPPPDTPRRDDTPHRGSHETECAEGWQTVFEGCQSGLRAFLRGRLSQESDVDDCLQSVYVKMIGQDRKPGGEVAPAARRAWLFRVAANEAARMWRSKEAGERMLRRHGGTEQEEIIEDDATEKVILAETTGKVRHALSQLPEAWREVVVLRIEENLTFQQIANRLDIPLGTALTRMQRALERLRDDIQPDNDS